MTGDGVHECAHRAEASEVTSFLAVELFARFSGHPQCAMIDTRVKLLAVPFRLMFPCNLFFIAIGDALGQELDKWLRPHQIACARSARPCGVVAQGADLPSDYVNLSRRRSFLIVVFGAVPAKAGYCGTCSRYWPLP
jgi:hypothetical protein